MLFYALKRLGVAVLVVVTVSVITFSLLHLSGDPAAAMAGENATQEDIEYVREHYGFDRPLIVQYMEWATSVLQGDLGESIYLKEMPVAEIIKVRAPVTMTLGACALSFALLLAIPLGVLAAIYPNTIIDRIALTIAVLGQAMPSFWFGLILMYTFSLGLGWLPSAGSATWKHYIMPSIALGYYAAPAIMRLTRAGITAAPCRDIRQRLWQKLAINAVINPLTASHRVRNGELAGPRFRPWIVALVAEIAQIMQAEGVLPPDAGWQAFVDAVIEATAANRSSMLQDVLAGRPTERDAILGPLIEAGRRHGLEVATIDALYRTTPR